MSAGGVLRVGAGRGFVMDAAGNLGRIVVTAAHCLPSLPPAHGMSHTHERTYRQLLAPLGTAPKVWAECLFVDPVADLAVLAGPDNQTYGKEADAYDALVDGAEPFPLGRAPIGAPSDPVEGTVLSLNGGWRACQISAWGRHLCIVKPQIVGGMSGSPIVVAGAAVGVIGLNAGGPQARLSAHLPAWLLEALGAAKPE